MTSAAAPPRPHGLTPMRGRDPHEEHRTATPLELFFDLIFVVAISIAGSQLAHQLASGHVVAGLLAFGLAMFSIIWCWINFSWFASAYDTDDWLMRGLTLVQMVGVIVLGLGLPAMFREMDHGVLDSRVMVAGYVVMRLSMIGMWLRVAQQDPGRRRTALTYAWVLLLAQVGWVLFAARPLPLVATAIAFTTLFFIEVGGVAFAERRGATPWHAHHIAERYSLLAIIALGEVILGTVTAVESVISRQGWSVNAVMIAAAGLSLAAGMWWCYFAVPQGELLHARRHRSFGWGYGHLPLYAGIAAVGAGLHVAAYELEGESKLSEVGTLLAIAIPLGVFLVGVYALYAWLVGEFDTFHLVLMAAMLVVLGTAIAMAAAGVPLTWCLVVLMLTPWVTVVGYETVGHRHIAQHLGDGAHAARSVGSAQ